MITARQENARTLAAAIGMNEDDADQLLDTSLLITAAPAQADLANLIRNLLSRTMTNVTTQPGSTPPVVEILIGDAQARSRARVVGVGIDQYSLEICDGRSALGARGPRITELLAACYASAAAVQRALDVQFPMPLRLPIEVDLAMLLGPDIASLTSTIDLGIAHLAGAGAIGNGYMLGLTAFDVRGELHICDPDKASDGNLNRCYWFGPGDVGAYKAERLVELAQPHLPALRLVPHKCVLKDVPAAREGGAWLEKLIVGVDSRRARRALQNELPHHVFDASTSGIAEVVLHFNTQPSTGACLSCIYYEAPDESAHEGHVAQALGVSRDEVKSNFITANAAQRIAARYDLNAADLENLAYDSVFKQLCGKGELKVEAQRVLAPFGFVSVLAGILLAIEVARRSRASDVASPFNYWRVSPWGSPVVRLREQRAQREGCESCGNEEIQAAARQLWK